MGMVYEQSTGNFYISGVFLERGFAGVAGEHQNNPASQCMKNIGPLPRGRYRMVPNIGSTKYVDSILLFPFPENYMCNPVRDEFLIHGDNRKFPRTGSTGCIVLSHPARLKIIDAIKHGNEILTVKL